MPVIHAACPRRVLGVDDVECAVVVPAPRGVDRVEELAVVVGLAADEFNVGCGTGGLTIEVSPQQKLKAGG